MLSREEQDIVDILEDSEIDFRWRKSKSGLSDSLFIRMGLTHANLSNELVKNLVRTIKGEYHRYGNAGNVLNYMNKKDQTILRIKKLTGYYLENYKAAPIYDVTTLEDGGGHIDISFSNLEKTPKVTRWLDILDHFGSW